MLGYFPTPHDDELLYSVIARYKIHCGLTSDRQVVATLFGSRDVAAVVDLPGHLRALEHHTAHLTNITAETWLMSHTLFPAYQHFLPKNRREKLVASMLEGRAWDVHTRIGHAAFALKSPNYLSICRACYENQIHDQGEPYWQRLFQLTGLCICPVHNEFLVSTNIPYRPASKFSFSAAIEAKIGPSLIKDFSRHQTDVLIRLGENLAELLSNYDNAIDSLDQWTAYYNHLAQQSDCLLSVARVDHVAVRNAVEQYWGHKVINHLRLIVNHKMDWLTNLFRKHRKSFHYLQHLTVWLALDGRPVSEILSQVSSMPALQATATTSVMPTANSMVHEKRIQWLLSQKLHPDKGVKLLRKLNLFGAVYSWLYRNDREWLFNHSPAKVRPVSSAPIVDWQARDKLLLQKCKTLYKQELLTNHTGRTSKAWLMKQIDRSTSLEKNQAKLPQTMLFLESLVESIEAYQQRRIEQVISALYEKHGQIETWMVYRKAGIRKSYQTPSLEQFIQTVIRKCLRGSARIFSKNSR